MNPRNHSSRGMEKGYRRLLGFFILNKWISFAILGFCVVVIVGLSRTLKSELAPLEDHSYIRTTLTAPEGTEYTTTQAIVDKVAGISMDSVPEADYVLARYGGGSSSSVNTWLCNNFSEGSRRKKSLPAADLRQVIQNL